MFNSTNLNVIDKRLVEFTRKYHYSLEAALEKANRESFPHHGEETKYINIFKASDGFVTFYLPAHPKSAHETGYYLYDYSKNTLNAICQSLSLNRLRVASPRLNQPWDTFDIMSEEVESISEIKLPWIHDDVREVAVAGKLASLPGMTISPIVRVEGGIRKYVQPSRVKVLSPVFNFPGIGERRLFQWTHADFWWFPEELDLDIDNAKNIAIQDILAFRTVLSSVPVLQPELAQQDTTRYAADILEQDCEEFLDLLSSEGDQEETIHQWLLVPRHHVFLDPHVSEVWSKLLLGDKISDFVIRRSDTTYIYVEIEPATKRIFRQDNSEPTADFNHACQQVKDWQRYTRDNVRTLRDELGLENIYEPSGMVVMGRSEDIDSDAAQIRWRDMKAKHDLDIYTYDELCNRVKSLAESLRMILTTVDDSS